jgi:hypothetical protein
MRSFSSKGGQAMLEQKNLMIEILMEDKKT